MRERSYTDEVKRFSAIVQELKNELNSFKEEIKESLSEINKSLKSVQKDNQITLEGDSRHGVKPVREVANDALNEAEKANRRIDHILWLVAGISIGAGMGGSLIIKIIFGI